MGPPRRRPGRATSSVTGDVELERALKAIGQSVRNKDLDDIARESLTPMKDKMAENARPRRQASTKNGQHLDQSIVIRRVAAKQGTYREFWISFKGRGQRIAHLVEFGTAPHAQPRRGIYHPGARPYPFARPAFESEKEGTGRIFGERVWQRIERSIKQVVR